MKKIFICVMVSICIMYATPTQAGSVDWLENNIPILGPFIKFARGKVSAPPSQPVKQKDWWEQELPDANMPTPPSLATPEGTSLNFSENSNYFLTLPTNLSCQELENKRRGAQDEFGELKKKEPGRLSRWWDKEGAKKWDQDIAQKRKTLQEYQSAWDYKRCDEEKKAAQKREESKILKQNITSATQQQKTVKAQRERLAWQQALRRAFERYGGVVTQEQDGNTLTFRLGNIIYPLVIFFPTFEGNIRGKQVIGYVKVPWAGDLAPKDGGRVNTGSGDLDWDAKDAEEGTLDSQAKEAIKGMLVGLLDKLGLYDACGEKERIYQTIKKGRSKKDDPLWEEYFKLVKICGTKSVEIQRSEQELSSELQDLEGDVLSLKAEQESAEGLLESWQEGLKKADEDSKALLIELISAPQKELDTRRRSISEKEARIKVIKEEQARGACSDKLWVNDKVEETRCLDNLTEKQCTLKCQNKEITPGVEWRCEFKPRAQCSLDTK